MEEEDEAREKVMIEEEIGGVRLEARRRLNIILNKSKGKKKSKQTMKNSKSKKKKLAQKKKERKKERELEEGISMEELRREEVEKKA